MGEFYLWAAMLLLITVALSLYRVLLGPTRADRMMGAQLTATGGIGVLLLLTGGNDGSSEADIALVLALLASFAVVAFAKAATSDGAGDPEEET